MLYKKKREGIEAHQWNGDWEEMRAWADRVSNGAGCALLHRNVDNLSCLQLPSPSGTQRAVNRGDYIVCAADGHWVWMDEETFNRLYELA